MNWLEIFVLIYFWLNVVFSIALIGYKKTEWNKVDVFIALVFAMVITLLIWIF